MYDYEAGIFEGCNEWEIRELLKRKTLEEWSIDTQAAKDAFNAYLAELENKPDAKWIEDMLRLNPLKQRALVGTDSDAFHHTVTA